MLLLRVKIFFELEKNNRDNKKIKWKEGFYRKDIGWRIIKKK